MNNDRRKAINAIFGKLEDMKEKFDFSALIEQLDELKSEIETVKDEEQEYYDKHARKFPERGKRRTGRPKRSNILKPLSVRSKNCSTRLKVFRPTKSMKRWKA